MSARPDGADEAFLEALLAGDLDAEREPARGRLAADDALRARWLELAELRRRLDAGSAAGREIRDEAARSIAAADVERTRRALDRARGADKARPAPRRFRPWLVAAAALVCATVGLWLALRPRDPAGTNTTLDASGIELVSPTGAWDPGEPLAWSYTLPPGGRYRVTVEVVVGAESIERTLYEPQWIPTSEEFARVASTTTVVVEAQDADGQSLARRRFSLPLAR